MSDVLNNQTPTTPVEEKKLTGKEKKQKVQEDRFWNGCPTRREIAEMLEKEFGNVDNGLQSIVQILNTQTYVIAAMRSLLVKAGTFKEEEITAEIQAMIEKEKEIRAQQAAAVQHPQTEVEQVGVVPPTSETPVDVEIKEAE